MELQLRRMARCSAAQATRPIDRVGLYVPGGKAAYPSSVLMEPRITGESGQTRSMVVPTPDGMRNALNGSSPLAGVDRVLTIGGAQAIAALAYGTATVPRVDIKSFRPRQCLRGRRQAPCIRRHCGY